ncbi:MAG: hypothetical protein HY673_00770 [Chloroflexi bacterium]|nr:hypothetical protein [Chloroflexota bacterium]
MSWYRDLIIIIGGSIATLALVLITVMVFLLWRRMGPLISSMDATAKTMAEVSSQIVNPMARILAVFQIITSVMDTAIKLFRDKGKEGEKHV